MLNPGVQIRVVDKAPPGPKPKRFGPDIVWDDQRRKWVKPGEVVATKVESKVPAYGDRLEEGSLLSLRDLEQHGRELLRTFEPEASPSYVNANEYPDVKLYTRSTHHSEINAQLRDDQPQSTETDQRILDTLVEQMKPLEEVQMLYRGINHVPEQLADADPGDVVDVDSFMSCSRDPSKAYNFTEFEPGGVLLEIESGLMTQGITLSSADTDYEEEETILNFGQRMEILDWKMVNMDSDDYGTNEARRLNYVVARMV